MYSAKVVINVKDNVQFVIDKDLISFTCSENLKNANLDFTPGIFEQNASIEIYDRDNTFKNIVQKYTDNFFYNFRFKKAFVAIILQNYKKTLILCLLSALFIVDETLLKVFLNETRLSCSLSLAVISF